MKRALCLVICFCAIFSLIGCQGNSAGSNQQPASTDPQHPPTCPDDLIAVAVPVTTEEHKGQDGKVIFSYSYQHMYLTGPDQKIADAIIIDFLNRVDQTRSVAEGIAQQAQNAYNGQTSWNAYMYQTTYSPMRIDKGILSLLGTNISVYGGPHPERTHMAANYDMLTGEVLTLGSILTHIDCAAVLCDLVIESLNAVKSEKFLYDGFEATVREQFKINESYNQRFYFSPDGLCFFFSPYEIAPYISGLITVEIPYAKLTGILSDAYFPEERETATGDISLEPFTNEALARFSQFSELNLVSDGTKLLLHADGMIHNVRIETGRWNLNGNTFVPEQTVFSAAALCQYDAIVLQDLIPDDMPTLRITFDSLGKTISYFISQDNGTILLLPA